MKTRILILSLVLLAACQPVELDYGYQKTLSEDGQQAGKGYTLTLKASKGVDTKAMKLDGNTLNAYWKSGEKVGVYIDGLYRGQLTATALTDSTKATLSGTLTPTGALAADKTITLLYPDREDITEGTKWDYTGQDGAAPTPGGDLSKKFDYMTATLTINFIDQENKKINITAPVSFQSEQSMFRFQFSNGSLLFAKSILVSTANGKLVRTRGWQENSLSSEFGVLTVIPASHPDDHYYYFSLRNETAENTDSFNFLLTGTDDILYSGTKAVSSKLSYGRFYNPSAAISLSPVDFSHIDTPIDDPDAVL